MEKFKIFLASREERLRRSLLLGVTIASPAMVVLRSKVVSDPDIWWHLRTGEWIYEHGTVPLTDHFSIAGSGEPWIAYSWLFELLVYGLYRWFGLPGLLYYNVLLSVAVATAIFVLVSRLESNFTVAVALTVCAVGGMLILFLTPRPWLLTILFFTVELDVLLTARRTGDYRRLWLLPPLFALWANLHIQFVYGFFLLGLFASEFLINRALRRFGAVEGSVIPPARMALVTAACVAATLVNPYHYRIYVAVFDIVNQSGFYELVSELQAPDFRSFTNWLALGVAIGAAFALGWRRRFSPLFILLLLAALYISFRSRRDLWFVVVTSVAIIAATRANLSSAKRYLLTKAQVLFIALMVCLLLVVTMLASDISDRTLELRAAQWFPAAAAAAVEERGYAGPLYNHFDWGGYLMWRLRHLPVALDGRGNVSGEKRTKQSARVWEGRRGWDSDPELSSSRLVIAQVDQPLASLLKLDPRFELVYEDAIAAVFVARDPGPQHTVGRR